MVLSQPEPLYRITQTAYYLLYKCTNEILEFQQPKLEQRLLGQAVCIVSAIIHTADRITLSV